MEKSAPKKILGNFNTSHVEVYQQFHFFALVVIYISIHLMLKFIRMIRRKEKKLTNISIHLMLKFIAEVLAGEWKDLNFTTSHVEVYRERHTTHDIDDSDFNTSHVEVYLILETLHISFYIISIHLMLKFIDKSIFTNATE